MHACLLLTVLAVLRSSELWRASFSFLFSPAFSAVSETLGRLGASVAGRISLMSCNLRASDVASKVCKVRAPAGQRVEVFLKAKVLTGYLQK